MKADNRDITTCTIHEKTRFIFHGAFERCSSLTEIIIPSGITSIEAMTFYQCYSLTKVVIPDSVTSIGDSAFYWCNLTEITIPASVTSIGANAFYCGSLKSIIFENTEGWWVSKSSSATSGRGISSTTLASTDNAAKYLTSTYREYYWYCNK